MESTVVFVKNLASGGAEKQAVLLAKCLTSCYDSHVIIWDGGRIDDRYAAMLEGSGVTVHNIYGGAFARFRGIVKLFRQLNPTVVFSYLTAANAAASLAGRITGTKVVSSLRTISLPKHKLMADRFVTNHLACATVANSHAAVKAFCSQGFKESKITAIPNCFADIRNFRPRKDSNGIVRLITVGRFVRAKDYPTAVKAFAIAADKIQGLRFDIVGYGPLENEIRKMVHETGLDEKVMFHINPPDIQKLLDKADIYISSSTFEGTSNSILEALNADLPVIATDAGDNSRLVVSGVNGFITKTGDKDGIADYIIQLAGDSELRASMGAASKRHLAESFSQQSFLNNYKNLIDNLK